MSFPRARERLQGAIFSRLGEDATWNGTGDVVRVRFAEKDEMASLGDSDILLAGLALRVSRSQVEAPKVGDVVKLSDSGRELRLIGEARLDANAVWTAPVADADAP